MCIKLVLFDPVRVRLFTLRLELLPDRNRYMLLGRVEERRGLLLQYRLLR